MTTKPRAPKGGTIGANGDFYEGGKFLPTTEKPKRHGSHPKGTGKQEIEPYVWQVAPEPGLRSIFRAIAGVFGRLDREGKTFVFDCSDQTMAYYRLNEQHCRSLIERYNRGERWATQEIVYPK